MKGRELWTKSNIPNVSNRAVVAQRGLCNMYMYKKPSAPPENLSDTAEAWLAFTSGCDLYLKRPPADTNATISFKLRSYRKFEKKKRHPPAQWAGVLLFCPIKCKGYV